MVRKVTKSQTRQSAHMASQWQLQLEPGTPPLTTESSRDDEAPGYMVLTASRNSSLTYLIQRLPGLSCTPVMTGNSLPTSVDSQPMAHIE